METTKRTVLCIDDTPTVRRLVQRILFRRYTVLEAADGLQGIDMATEHHPDLIFVDLHMPHLTGYEVTTRIKSLLPQTPIIALTADVSENVRERALASGCDGYLAKPIDPDAFLEKVKAYLGGEREELEDNTFRVEYQRTLVERLEEKVRELTQTLEENQALIKQNRELLAKSRRRARLLEGAARVGRSITSILDMDVLLNATVDIICDEFDFYYAGLFLLDDAGEWAVLRAGHGEAGKQMLAAGHKLRVGGKSMVGETTWLGVARIALNVAEAASHFQNPRLPLTRAEIALPLVIAGETIGALSVQSAEEAAFSEDDITALQAMADQLAVAINNAHLLTDLEAAHTELVRTKTFEAIATATGEAIHWVGNKAAPIPGSVARIQEDLARYLVAAGALLEALPEAAVLNDKYGQLVALALAQLAAQGIDLDGIRCELAGFSWRRLRRILSVESIFEDLAIITESAQAILNIKEDLIGPARQRRVQAFGLNALLEETVASMGIATGVVTLELAPDLPPVCADRVQLGRVFINLIKNALEAMVAVAEPQLRLVTRPAEEPGFIVVEVVDTGVGILEEQLEKIWMAFYTTKGDRGGTGLGLTACAQIVGDLGGKITVESEVGVGTTFGVQLPLACREE